jgi:hypothetical protein
LFIFFDVIFNREGASLFVIGLLAVLIAFLPGGVVGTLTRLVRDRRIPESLARRYVDAREQAVEEAVAAEEEAPEPSVVASPLGRELLESRR